MYQPIPQTYQAEDMANNQRLLGQNAEIAEAIQELIKTNNKLERMLAKIGTKGDDQSFRNGMEKQRTSAKTLTRNIMDMLKHHQGDKQVFAKLTAQFQSALSSFNKISQDIERKQSRVVAYSMSHKPSTILDRESVVSRGGTTPKNNINHNKGRSVNDDEDGSNDNATNNGDRQQLLQQQEYSFREFQEDEILAKKEEIQQIERDVEEVAIMFKDLDQLVREQQVHIDVIDTNITAAKVHVEEGHGQLVQAEEYQKSARKKKMLYFIYIDCCIGIGGPWYCFTKKNN